MESERETLYVYWIQHAIYLPSFYVHFIIFFISSLYLSAFLILLSICVFYYFRLYMPVTQLMLLCFNISAIALRSFFFLTQICFGFFALCLILFHSLSLHVFFSNHFFGVAWLSSTHCLYTHTHIHIHSISCVFRCCFFPHSFLPHNICILQKFFLITKLQ